MDKSSSIWLPHRSVVNYNHHNDMYSAGVPVPQEYHITVANSFSPVKWYPGEFHRALTGDLVPGYQI